MDQDGSEEGFGVAADAAGLSPSVEPASSLAGFAASIPNAGHSASPWVLGAKSECGDYQFIDAPHAEFEWRQFARVVIRTDGEADSEGEANARLIAAAPMLYEGALDAVKAFKLLRVGMANDPKAIEVIDAHVAELEYAIGKAEA